MPQTDEGLDEHKHPSTIVKDRIARIFRIFQTILLNSKWFSEPGSDSRSCSVIDRVWAVLKRTVVGDSD